MQLAPYNTHYDTLNLHLQSAGIRTELTWNHWNSPVYINKENSSNHSLLPPKDFTTFVIPFKIQEDSVSVTLVIYKC
jgi:beta-glucosidase/6-phospho-beta-glucosidase/beta-galactosidase